MAHLTKWDTMGMTLEQRLNVRIDRRGPDDCWNWSGALTRKGYGHLGGKTAHRSIWKQTFGEIPDGLHVLHRCDNRRCCNPAHLFLGTNLDNIADSVAKGRPHGPLPWNTNTAKLTIEQVRQIRELAASNSRIEIGALFAITPDHVGDIINRKVWKCV